MKKDLFFAANIELAFPGNITQGARGNAVKRLQEWLCFHKFATPVDSSFGPATRAQMAAFQTKIGAPVQNVLTEAVWRELVTPLENVLAPIELPAGATLPDAVLAFAKQHFAALPIEIGGDNLGPWVRTYMDGQDGADQLWCAGFATFIVAQAGKQLNVEPPISRTVSCDEIGDEARHAGRLLRANSIDWNAAGTSQLFLVQSPDGYSHVGIAYAGAGQTFSTIEGNADHRGGQQRGYEVCSRVRSIAKMNFVRLG